METYLTFRHQINNMRKIYLGALLVIALTTSCNLILDKTVTGNGNIKTEDRDVSHAERIKSYGSFDVEIVQGTPASVTVKADENLLPYITTTNEDGALVIRTKDHYNIRSDDNIKVTVVTDRLEEVQIAGSGNVKSYDKFTGGDHLKIGVAGSGDIDLNINTPEIESSIAGTGNIRLRGETRESKIEIAGMGDYMAGELMSEKVEIHIQGSGNAEVFAENELDINIAGSGDVKYKGNAVVKQKIAGSGKITKAD